MVVERNSQFLSVEMKSGSMLSRDQFKGLKFWNELTGNEGQSALVYGGEQAQQRHEISVVPWQQMGSLWINKEFEPH